jgi:Baseplate J-like protein
MPLLLPNLDDRTWADLIDEGRSLIPVYGPEWTDHNVHDPGITIMELLAWIAEMDIYRLNQISDDEKRRFLALIGVSPRPPRPAWTVLGFRLKGGASPVTLPRGLEFSEADPAIKPAPFRTLEKITVVPGAIEALQVRNGGGFQNLNPTWRRRAAMNPFGASPMPGAEFYLGLSQPLPAGVRTSIFFTLADGYSGRKEQRRFREEAASMKRDCRPFENPCGDNSFPDHAPQERVYEIQHYGVRTDWEYLALINGKPEWRALNRRKHELRDETRAFTFDGPIDVSVPTQMTAALVGAVPYPLYYLRCRFEAGRYDAAPVLQDVTFNGMPAEQAVPVTTSPPFDIEADAQIVYSSAGPPDPNQATRLRLYLNSQNRIKELHFGDGHHQDPKFRVLEYLAPADGNRGRLNVEAVLLGFGNGLPAQELLIPGAPLERSTLRVYTLEGDQWRDWEPQNDFDGSKRTNSDYLIDPTAGVITFGNGENGSVPAAQSLIFATYRTTRAEAGNVAALTINQLAESDHNRALLYDPTAVPNGWEKLKSELDAITNPIAAAGGARAETIVQAMGRADRLVDSSERAITLADYERLAVNTPGTRIGRVTARANLHPGFPCFDAPGLITVIVLPYLPKGRPVPSAGLLRAVAAYLGRRRIVGTRVEVVGPKYLEVTVRANVAATRGTNQQELPQAIAERLNEFLDPLSGGPDGKGWPFGRDVFRAEIMRVIDEVPGVDHVIAMDLFAAGCEPQCGNVCLGPTWLVSAGLHEITVL